MTSVVAGWLAAAGLIVTVVLHLMSYAGGAPVALEAAVVLLAPLPILVGWQIISSRRLGIASPAAWPELMPAWVRASGWALFVYLVLAFALGEIRGEIHDRAWQLRALTGALLWFYWMFTTYFCVTEPRARVRLPGAAARRP